MYLRCTSLRITVVSTRAISSPTTHVTFCTHTESIAHTNMQNNNKKKKNISCKIMIEIVFRFLNKIMDDKESLPAVLFLLRGQTVIWMFYWYRSNCWLDRDTFCSVWKYHTAKKATPLPPHFRWQGRLFSIFLHRIQTLQPIRTAVLNGRHLPRRQLGCLRQTARCCSRLIARRKLLLSLLEKRRESSTIPKRDLELKHQHSK